MSRQPHLLRKTETRALILNLALAHRPGWKCTRVSESTYAHYEALLRARILSDLKCHPTVGHTFRPDIPSIL